MKLVVLALLGLWAGCTAGDVGASCARHSDCVAPLRCSATGTCEVAAPTTDAGTGDGDITNGDVIDAALPDAAVPDATEVDAP